MPVEEQGLIESFARLCDQVRHPVLEIGLFASAAPEVGDEFGVSFVELGPSELPEARLRRGALLYAANLVFDEVLDDLVVMSGGDSRLGEPDDRFVDQHLPSRYRYAYDEEFHRKLVAIVAAVASTRASPDGAYPACTAEELVLSAILREWQVLLETTDLGQAWADLTEYLLEDTDFEALFASEMDGIEDDPLAHKTTGLVVNAVGDWFVPFDEGRVVHPYAVELVPQASRLYDLTRIASEEIVDPGTLVVPPGPVRGLDPVSEVVALARADLRRQPGRTAWVPDETDPARSLAEIELHAGCSGVLSQQTGPDGDITEVPVLAFSPHPAHPATGEAWAAVMYLSGHSELPLSAVVSFEPDPSVRERWNAMFEPPAT